ncbi:hypothetical protein RCL1_003909 [Eukaryota sp. TZLM3-RCL]
MVQSYLRFEHEESFGITASVTCSAVTDPSGRFLFAPAADFIAVWNRSLGTLEARYSGEFGVEVTCLKLSPTTSTLAAGYSNGSIRLFNIQNGDLINTFNGHRSAVLHLSFSDDSTSLASGGLDTDVVVWDLVSGKGTTRLKGHSGPISGLSFIPHQSNRYILTCSRDMTLRLWDVELSYCVDTVVGSRVELWSLAIFKFEFEDDYIITLGTPFHNLLLYTLSFNQTGQKRRQTDDSMKSSSEFSFKFIGNFDRTADNGHGRCTMLQFLERGGSVYLLASGKSRGIDLYSVLSDSERQKRLKKRKKRRVSEGKSDDVALEAIDYFKQASTIRSTAQIVGFDCYDSMIAITQNTNSIEIHPIFDNKKSSVLTLSQGHSGPISDISIAKDDSLAVSCSVDGIRAWSLLYKTQSLFIPCTFKSTCCAIVPGNRFVVIGTKEGHLLVADLSTTTLCTITENAHNSAITSVVIESDCGGVISSSFDKSIKFWNFDLVQSQSRSVLSLTLSRTLELNDGITTITTTHDGKLVIAALLDTTIKVFFHDTFKLFLSLYGHKLPVTCLSVSFDNTKLISGSNDKSVKIWGLDFGDCHRSILAHEAEVTDLSFLPGTHHFVSSSKDKSIKYFDADNFNHLQTLKINCHDVTSLAVSSNGGFFLSGAKDFSIQLVRKSSSILFPHLEEGDNLESSANLEAAQSFDRERNDLNPNLPTIVTTVVVKYGDKLVTALDTCQNYLEAQKSYLFDLLKAGIDPRNITKDTALPQLPPLLPLEFNKQKPTEYLLSVLQSIPSAELADAVAYVSFALVPTFLSILSALCEVQSNNIELVSKVVVALLLRHSTAFKNSSKSLFILNKLSRNLVDRVDKEFKSAGKVLAGLLVLQREIEGQSGVLFDHTTGEAKKKPDN